MGRVVVVNTVTLDGVMQAPARPDEDTRGGFEHGGWARAYQDGAIAGRMAEMMARARGSLLLGRWTYESFYSVWPKRKNNPFTEQLSRATKYVASETLKEPLAWQNSILLTGDVAEAVAALKSHHDGDLTILGSGELVRSLFRRDLIDEYVLTIAPIVLGSGQRLFPEGKAARLRLVDSLVGSNGAFLTTYRSA